MNDNTITEIDFDEEETSQTLDTGMLVDESGQAEGTTTGAPRRSLKVGVLGSNAIAKSIPIMFSVHPKLVTVTTYDTIDDAVDAEQNIYYICLDPVFTKKEFDDASVIDACLKVSKSTTGTIVLKTTVPFETVRRINTAVDPDRFIYSPEEATDDDLQAILRSEFNFIGATPKSIQSYSRLLAGASLFDRTAVGCSAEEIACVKAGLVGLKAVQQTFWNQLYDYASSADINFSLIKRIINNTDKDKIVSIPTFIKASLGDGESYKKSKSFGGEYLNSDAKVFASMTDKFPLLDECINYKNLHDPK